MKYVERTLKPVRHVLRILLLGEETSFTEWAIFSLLFGIYLGYSLAIVETYGTTVVLEWTRFSHDNTAHLYIPRTIIDNGEQSKLANLGVVWLPLYHLVIATFTLVNILYYTGLAGSLVNIFFTASTAVLLYRIVRGKLGVIASIVYGLNMYTVLHASSSYMIPIGQFLTLASIYYFEKYLETNLKRETVKSIIYGILATISRYEAWIPIFLMFIIFTLRESFKTKYSTALAYSNLYLWGFAGWLLYNMVIFNNPLQFIHHPSAGASGYYLMVLRKIMFPLEINCLNIASTTLTLAGPVILLTILVIFPILESRKNILPLTIYVSPLIFLLAEGPELLIKDHPLYFYFLLPFILTLSFKPLNVFIKYLKKKNMGKALAATYIVVLAILAFQTLYELNKHASVFQEINSTYHDYLEYHKYAETLANYLSQTGGYILYSSLIGSYRFSVVAAISPRVIFDEYDLPPYLNVSKNPWNYNVTIVILPSPTLYWNIRESATALIGEENYMTLFYENSKWRTLFLKHYYKYATYNNLEIYFKQS